MDFLFTGILCFIGGCIFTVGYVDSIVEAYARNCKMYKVGDKFYEIREVKDIK